MLLVGFVLMRVIEPPPLEARSALRMARREQKLTLRSGGAAFVVDASDVVWARAAANYVEVATPGKTYLARMTLTRLETLLLAAGNRHMRVHRSHVVNVAEVRGLLAALEATGTVRSGPAPSAVARV
jgi:DNA-binding LytR/AlgR family response regulator